MIVSGVEYQENGEILGWALDRENADDNLLIEAFLGDRLIGMATADLPRADATPETNGHGFRIGLRRPLTEESIPRLAIYATALSGDRALLGMSQPVAGETGGDSGGERPAANLHTGADDSQYPVFVLGAPRSGTTVVTQSLLGLPKYEGVEEDHVLELAARLTETVDAHYAKLDHDRRGYIRTGEMTKLDTLDQRIPAAVLKDSVQSIFIELMRSTFRSDHWIVKTPTAMMVHSAPLLHEMWPRSRFIFMKRRAIENVLSRTRKFHKEKFRDHCTAWSDAMWSWLQVRATLAGAAIEVDQLLVARAPRRAAAAIGAFLTLSEAETAYLERAFSQERPEQTGDTFGSISDAEKLAWTSEEVKIFESTCGSMMEEFGYDFGERYYREGEEDRELVLV